MSYARNWGADFGWWVRPPFGRGPGPGNHGPGHGHHRGRFRRQEWWAELFGDPPPRAERGEVRYLVLHALEESPRHGYEVIQFIEQKSGGTYRPSPGVVYPTLQMLEELEHARAVEREGRKVYEITDAGRAELAAHRALIDEFYERFEDAPWEDHAEELADVAKRFARLMKAFRRAARRGRASAATLRAIWSALDEALEKIERTLDNDEGR